MDLLTLARTAAESGLLLALCWPLAGLLRRLASRGVGASARTWLVAAQALIVAALLLPVFGRILMREPLTTWAPVQVWSGNGPGAAAAAHIAVNPDPRERVAATPAAVRALAPWVVSIVSLAALGALWRLARLARTLTRLRRHLESLPVLRSVGRVRVVACPEGTIAYSARVGGRAWAVIPSTALASDACRRFTLLHELQHHRQRDTSWAIAGEALAACFWWNPALGPLGHTLSALEELACDEALVARKSIDRAGYAACLVDAATRAQRSGSMPAHVASMAIHAPQLLKRRIEMICTTPRKRARSLAIVTVLAVFGVLASVSFVARGAVADRRISRGEAEQLAAAASGTLAVQVDDQVLAELNRLAGSPEGREFVRGALSRMPDYRAMIEQALADAGLPLELLAVPLVESGFQNMDSQSKLPSMAPGQRGAGIWMFIPATARRYGLHVDAVTDERLDPVLETRAAVALLSELHERYGGWPLALAAYNQGERTVDAAVAAGRTDRLNGYTSTVLATVLVLRNPALVD